MIDESYLKEVGELGRLSDDLFHITEKYVNGKASFGELVEVVDKYKKQHDIVLRVTPKEVLAAIMRAVS